MAARIRKIRNDEEHRNRIRTTQLVKRLTLHALGKVDMQKSAVTAALGLIRKTLPDLSATTLAGDANNPLRWQAIQERIVDPKETPAKLNGGTHSGNGADIQAVPDSEQI